MSQAVLALAAASAVFGCASPQASSSAQPSSPDDLSGWIGQKAKPFAIKDAQGRLVDLANEIGRKPIVLVFYRGQWCPLCRGQFRELKAKAVELKAAGAVVYGISNEPAAELKKLPEGEGLSEPFVFLSDSEGKAMALYTRMNGQGNAFVPGTFVIGKDGMYKLADRNEDYRKRPSADAVLAAVKH